MGGPGWGAGDADAEWAVVSVVSTEAGENDEFGARVKYMTDKSV